MTNHGPIAIASWVLRLAVVEAPTLVVRGARGLGYRAWVGRVLPALLSAAALLVVATSFAGTTTDPAQGFLLVLRRGFQLAMLAGVLVVGGTPAWRAQLVRVPGEDASEGFRRGFARVLVLCLGLSMVLHVKVGWERTRPAPGHLEPGPAKIAGPASAHPCAYRSCEATAVNWCLVTTSSRGGRSSRSAARPAPVPLCIEHQACFLARSWPHVPDVVAARAWSMVHFLRNFALFYAIAVAAAVAIWGALMAYLLDEPLIPR
jgi:hypothetical protein